MLLPDSLVEGVGLNLGTHQLSASGHALHSQLSAIDQWTNDQFTAIADESRNPRGVGDLHVTGGLDLAGKVSSISTS